MIDRAPVRKSAAPRGEPVILFSVGSRALAIAASAVEEIRNTAGLQPLVSGLAGHAAKVKFALERDGKTYFVVDANIHLHLFPSQQTRVLVLRNSRCALLVDAIDRMTEIATLYALPRAFEGEERKWFRGLALLGEEVLPVVNPAVLSAAEVHEAEALLLQVKGAAIA